MKRVISLLLIFSILFSFYVTALAAPSISATYNGQSYSSGSSIHYTGSEVTVTVTSDASSSMNFGLYINGVNVGSVTSYTFTNPAGPQYIKVSDGSSFSQEIIINMYKDVTIDPNATYSYVSYKAVINEVEHTSITPSEVNYNDGADSSQVNTLFDTLISSGTINASAGGTYTISGYLFVRVFDNSNNIMGEYNCYSLSKVPGSGPGFDGLLDYNWDSGTKSGLVDRGSWAANHTYAPTRVPGFQIVYNGQDKTDSTIDISSKPYYVDLIDNSKNATTYKWYIKTPTHSDFTLFSTDKNPTNVTVWSDGITYFKQEIDGGLTVTHSITAKLPGTATLIKRGINKATGAILAEKSESLTYDLTNGTPYTRSYTDLGSIPNATIAGSAKAYTSIVPTMEAGVTSQTILLDSTHTTGYMFFFFDVTGPTPTSTPTPTPTPTPSPSNKPPEAVINSADKVMRGDDINITSDSYDEDGYITKYEWNAPDAKTPIIGFGSTTWFDKEGFVTVSHRVTDNGGASASASKSIEVLPPIPTAVIDYKGRTKENYKITLDSTKSKSPMRYQVDITKTVWKIEAVSGCTDNDIKYLGGLSGISTKDFLVKKQGQIKVTLTVTNTAGYSNSTYTYINISPNLPPVAQFIVPKKSLREFVDQWGNRYGETTVYDTSYSPDGDKIIYRKFYCRYDSNNNGNFLEELLDLFYEGTATQATKRYYNNQGVGWCMYDIQVTEDLMEKDAYGNYINTIPEFILPEDIKTTDTFSIQ